MADYDEDSKPTGLIGKPKAGGGMWDWLTKKASAQAADKPKKMDNLDEDKLKEVSNSFKSAF